MKRIITALTFTIPALALPGAAVSGQGFIEQARVIDAQPVYETVEVAYPVTECWTERVIRNDHGHGNYAAPITGGIVGGLLGHRLGKGRGRAPLAVVGTLLGASIGHEYNASHSRRRPVVDHVRRCETVDRYEQQQKVTGYHVKYRYDGQTFYTQTSEHPGQRIPVRVSVSPANGY